MQVFTKLFRPNSFARIINYDGKSIAKTTIRIYNILSMVLPEKLCSMPDKRNITGSRPQRSQKGIINI